MIEYLKRRFYLRGTTKLGVLNIVLAFLFNIVIVRVVYDNGKVEYRLDWGTNHPRKDSG